MCKLKYFDKFKLNVEAPFIYWAMTLWANMMCFLINTVVDVRMVSNLCTVWCEMVLVLPEPVYK